MRAMRVVHIDIGGGKGTERGSSAGTQTWTAEATGGGILEGEWADHCSFQRTQEGVLHVLVPYVGGRAGMLGHSTANAPA